MTATADSLRRRTTQPSRSRDYGGLEVSETKTAPAVGGTAWFGGLVRVACGRLTEVHLAVAEPPLRATRSGTQFGQLHVGHSLDGPPDELDNFEGVRGIERHAVLFD